MEQELNNKKKYIIIIFVCVVLMVLVVAMLIGIGIINRTEEAHNVQEQNIIENEEQNDIENEIQNDVVKVIIDQQENETTEKEQENNTEQPKEENSNKEANVNKETTSTNNKKKYYIKINNQANVVTIYKKDNNGNYTVPVKAMICSIGDATPESGVYKISDKYTWRLLQGDVYGQYAVRITGHILFHSVPYTARAKDTLEWWEYDKLGTKASLGCIRLKVEDAKWIYDNCAKGTQVEFYYDENPGPLGKPSAKKISGYSDELKKWDPTDPDSNNPWKTYVEEQQQTEITPEETLPPEQESSQTNANQVETPIIENSTIENENTEQVISADGIENSTI